MWKHELISQKDIPEDVRRYLIESTQFYFGNVGNFHAIRDEHIKNDDVIEVLPPPYNITLLEFESAMDNGEIIKVAALYVVEDEFSRIYMFMNTGYWHMCFKYAYIDEQFGVTYHTHDYYAALIIQLPADLILEQDKASRNLIGSTYQNVMLLLEVLNTKNVITKCKIPPEALNRKRVKRHHVPYDKYYILEVVKGSPRNKNFGDVPWDYKSPADMAFHMCRGHFKTYTEEAPLFGKYAGTFWWQPQARGKKENGTISKDYEVINEGK